MSFKVCINEGEWEQICDWVSKYQDIETGGDLFGLWLDEQTAVVQFVLGPGAKCKRTTTSFFQDVDYLREAGMYLTKQHGLCNVGQWHSHHKIKLFEPSAGDKNTVWSNMPKLGLDRYIVFIANILSNEVTIHCFLFQIKKGKQLSVKRGEFKVLPGNSPMRLNEKILQNVHNGAEPFNDITVFGKEIKYMRNKEAIENFDNSNENENKTSSYTGNRIQHVAPVSVEREKTKNPQRIISTASSVSMTQAKQGSRDPPPYNKSNRVRVTGQSTSKARDESFHSSWRSQDHRTITNSRSEKNDDFRYIPNNTQKQREKQGAMSKTNKQASENSNFLTPSGVQEQWTHKEERRDADYRRGQPEHKKTQTITEYPHSYTSYAATPSTSDYGLKRPNYKKTTPQDKQKQRAIEKKTLEPSEGSKPALNAEQKSQERHIDKDRNNRYSVTRKGGQQLQSSNDQFRSTASKDINVIVNQPEGFVGLGRFPGNVRRKSGDYDNVKSDTELHQHEKNRPNSQYGRPSKGKPEKIPESPSTPSGTFRSSEVEIRHKYTQTELSNTRETTQSRWTRLYNRMCCKRPQLSEPVEEKIRRDKVETNDGTKIFV